MDATSKSGNSNSRLSVDKPIDAYRKELKPKIQKIISLGCKKELAEIKAIKADWQQSVKAIDKNFEKIKNSMDNIIRLLDKIDDVLEKNEESSDESLEKKYASISDLKKAAVSVNTATDGAMKKTKNLISTIKRTNVNQFDGNKDAIKLFTQLGNEANKLSKLINPSTEPIISKSYSKKNKPNIDNDEISESSVDENVKKGIDGNESILENEKNISKEKMNSSEKKLKQLTEKNKLFLDKAYDDDSIVEASDATEDSESEKEKNSIKTQAKKYSTTDQTKDLQSVLNQAFDEDSITGSSMSNETDESGKVSL